MIHYHMGGLTLNSKPALRKTGKRIRPLVCLLACEAAGGNWRQAVPVMPPSKYPQFHLSTMMLKTWPDASRPRQCGLFGMPQTINTGDAICLFTLAAIGRLLDLGIAPATVVTAMRRFDEIHCIDAKPVR